MLTASFTLASTVLLYIPLISLSLHDLQLAFKFAFSLVY